MFEQITHELYGAKKNGFVFDMNYPREMDKAVAKAIGHRRTDICLDSFCDLDGDLYRDENGFYYAVQFVYVENGYKPLCWQRLKKIEIGDPELAFEISEIDAPLDAIISVISKKYPGWKFSRTEKRYESCVMAIFEKP